MARSDLLDKANDKINKLFRNLVYIWLICMVAAILFCFISVINADPEEPVEGLFFADLHDVGMDHYNSLFATSEKSPYTQYNITYPPLAALIYYVFFLCLDKNLAESMLEQYPNISNFSLRENATAVVPYIMYVAICVVLIACLIQRNLNVSAPKKTAAIIGFLLTNGFISILDRGNNVLLVALLLLYYIFYYNSKNKFLSETALIALALATGIKLYPVVFGVLLIRRHKIAEGFRAVAYILLALFLPFFFFEGIEGIKLWIERLFPSGNVIPIHPGALNFVSAVNNIEVAYNIDIPDFLVSSFTPFFIVVGIIFAITYKKDYKAVIFGVFAILGFAGVTFKYFLFLSILPMMYLFVKCDGVRDRIYAILLILLNIPLCLKTPEYLEGTGFFMPDLIYSFLVLAMLAWLLIDGCIDFIGYMKNKRWKYLLKTEKHMANMPDVAVWEE